MLCSAVQVEGFEVHRPKGLARETVRPHLFLVTRGRVNEFGRRRRLQSDVPAENLLGCNGMYFEG